MADNDLFPDLEITQIKFEVLPMSRLREHQAFRYQVFGEELGYLNESTCPDRLDSDEYDPYSSHILASYKGVPIACCRVIYNNSYPKPSYTEKFFNLPPPALPRDAIAELGRFALASNVRNPRLSLMIRFGLLGVACEDALSRGVSHFYVFMHGAGYALLRRSGIPCEMIQNYKETGYNGYYSDYFDPNDTYPSLMSVTTSLLVVRGVFNSFVK
ncbi:MAG: GNAT family N-acyltransferase [Capsulimonadales bacterium]|nr:GNAT family N-acyltransferase [Capsulimonadales bacterium]